MPFSLLLPWTAEAARDPCHSHLKENGHVSYVYFSQLEGTGFEIPDERFERCLIPHARVERFWTGGSWSEGPAWFAGGRYLVWSDIPNNRMVRLDDFNKQVSLSRAPSQNSNGNTVDQQGRLITCVHLSRCLTRTDHNGSITVPADRYQGKRLNSPNDVVVKSDESIWFTDPTMAFSMTMKASGSKAKLAPAMSTALIMRYWKCRWSPVKKARWIAAWDFCVRCRFIAAWRCLEKSSVDILM
jgi:hypothetical protein